MKDSKTIACLVAAPLLVAAGNSDQLFLEQQLLRNLDSRNLLDRTWPADNCCRIYEHDSFTGADTNGEDFCTDNETDEKVIDFEQVSHAWDNKMSSWKCGRNTAVKFCTRSNGYRCEDSRHYGESAGGNAESQDTGIDNSLTKMVLTPYDPAVLPAITVFSMTECHGDSAVLWSNVDYSSTTSGEGRLTLGNNIKSIMVPEGSDWQVDLYAL